jgi:putative membrane protein
MVSKKLEFDAADHERVRAAVVAAEARSSAEIVPVLARDSGRYDRAEDAFGVIFGLLAMILVWFVYPAAEPNSWAGPPPLLELVALVAAVLVGFGLGTVLASRLPGLRRLAIFPAMLREETELAARALFHDERIHHTRRASAVLIYVSLYEHVVCVLPDEQAEAALGPEALAAVRDKLTAELRRGDPIAALVAAIELLGEKLAEALPGDADDDNELEDALILVD